MGCCVGYQSAQKGRQYCYWLNLPPNISGMRLCFLLCAFLCTLVAANAQLTSPEAFLGYPVGSRFTPHHRIVAYFRQVAAALPARVKLVEYGQTNEGRPLIAAFVSAPEHIARLDDIARNNRGLARLDGSRSTSDPRGAPVITWLSYNVHGNEPSSSEAAIRTLWELVSPANTAAQQWLQNSVVVIDPCINPDGRDRYVNWFNSMVGTAPDASLSAREHNEPWPGGRVNHYYFDLNRDWAWQTQKETAARMALYQKWMPQVHVDFHEQGINNPYYFAPAAEPYHEVITPWQRRFQETIGRNHARYFDQKGWLYFTREVFDLFYPAYGDTWPLYNGAIGMTYEQAGGPAGGLAALTAAGDTLTLADRVEHHFTTGMSTIETASKNATELMTQFQQYFRDAVEKGNGPYKTYVIRADESDRGRIEALVKLLQKNGIDIGNAKGGSLRGYNYETGKEERFTLTGKDLVIPSRQAKSALVRVFFEPNPHLADSLTYDITAWSLPYVFGLHAYAVPEEITPTSLLVGTLNANISGTENDRYGFVVPWNGMPAARFAAKALRAGIRVRFAQKPFTLEGRHYDRGSLILLRNGNSAFKDMGTVVYGLAGELNDEVSPQPIKTGMVESGADFGSSSVRPLLAPRVALLSGEGTSANAVGEVWHYFDQVLGYPVTLINSGNWASADLSKFNVIILPNGNYRFLNDKASAESLRSWVTRGGKLIALEGAMGQLAALDWGIKARKSEDSADSKNPYAALRRYEDREREEISAFTPGSIYRVELDNTHPLAFGYPGRYYTLRQDDRVYDFFTDGGWNVGVIKKERPLAGFVGNRLQPRLQDALIFGVQEMGRGQVVCLADDVLFRSFWENGKLLFANAVFLVGQ
jgi:hypothetical protein